MNLASVRYEWLDPVEHPSPERYRMNAESDLRERWHRINDIVNERLAV